MLQIDIRLELVKFRRAMLCKCGLCRHAVSVCPSVRLSVTFVDSTNKHIFQIFSPSGRHAILVFPHQTSWHYCDGDLPNGGVECRRGRQKSRLSTNIWLLIDDWWSANNCSRPPCTDRHASFNQHKRFTKRIEKNRIYYYAAMNLKRK